MTQHILQKKQVRLDYITKTAFRKSLTKTELENYQNYVKYFLLDIFC